MAENNFINGKKKALLALKEKILDEIKYCEKNIDDLRLNLKNNNFYEDLADSSDSEDDFPSPIDMGPSITQLKLQQSMLNTCLRATEELTSLTILQSSVDLLVDEPKFEGEPPVTEAGTWREVIAECRIDLIHFTMSFFMHTPHRKFGQASYRGLRVVPVKPTHELELAKSVLHTVKLPGDAVEVLRSYAAGYRSRRTTLARLADKYTNALFMEPHPEGGFVMKCADLLEVSWRLENKRSPLAPFHHAMKFDLEFMEETFVKIISQTHKQLLNPAIPTDERTLLLAKIITTCLEARGPIDTESDLESKTTERDNDIDKRDSEVMAPPKSLPKKVKQKCKEVTTAQKRSIDDENGDTRAKKMKNDAPETRKSTVDVSNPRKTKINDADTESGKKRKVSEVNKVTSAKNVKENGNTDDVNNKEDKTGNTKPKNAKQSGNDGKTKTLKAPEENTGNRNSKTNNVKESESNDKNIKTKNQITKETGENVIKEKNTKGKNLKENGNTENGDVNNKEDNTGNTKPKNAKQSGNDGKTKTSKAAQENTGNRNSKTNTVKESESNDKNIKTKNQITKETGENLIKEKNTKGKNLKENGNTEDRDVNNKEDNTGNTKPRNSKKSGNDGKTKNLKDAEENTGNRNSKTNNVKESESNDKSTKVKNQISKETSENVIKEKITKTKNLKEHAKNLKEPVNIDGNTKSKTRIDKETNKIQENDNREENTKDGEKDKATVTKLGEKNAKGVDKNKGNAIKSNAKEPVNADKVKNVVIKPKTVPAKGNDNSEEKKKSKTVVNTKDKENIDSNKDAGHPKSKVSEKTINNEKNTHKIDGKPKDNDSAKVKNVANTKNDKQATKKTTESNINVANTKNDGQPKKVSDKKVASKGKISEVANKEKTANTNVKNVTQTVKKVTERNATNLRIKDKISQITNKVTEKVLKEKLLLPKNVPEKVLNSNTKEPTNSTKNIINKKPTITKIASHRNSLKPQNPPKILKTGNTKPVSTGNTEKENGGKGSKIPQKKTSLVSEGSSKRNMLRISPRKLPSKFKTTSQQVFKQKVVKSTNIPRLLKKPAPKTG